MPDPRPHDPHHPRIGIALGSGSARGLAHIGILQALEEAGITPHIISGSSIGALVGACHVTGQLEALADWATSLSLTAVIRFLNLRPWAAGGMADASRLMRHLEGQFGNPTFEELDRPFAVVATDLYRAREIWLETGPVWDAVRASISIPGVLTPIYRDHRWLVDGGLVNPVPVSVCRALGADRIIAVNLNSDLVRRPVRRGEAAAAPRDELEPEEEDAEHTLLGRISTTLLEATGPVRELMGGDAGELPALLAPSTLTVMMNALNMMQDRITRSRLAGDPADVLLSPRLGDIGFLEFSRGDEAIAEGRACVERMLPMIRHALEMEE